MNIQQRTMTKHLTIGPCACIFSPYGQLGILSNFAATPLKIGDQMWPSVEHFFQSQKFIDAKDRERVRAANFPIDAKRLAWDDLACFVRPDWDLVRRTIMRTGLEAKLAQYSAARDALARTWPMQVVENSSTDEVWGIGATGHGANEMGRLLEEARARLLGHDAGTGMLCRSFCMPRDGDSGVAWTSVDLAREGKITKNVGPLAFLAFADTSIDDLVFDELATRRLLDYIDPADVKMGLPLRLIIERCAATEPTRKRAIAADLTGIRAAVFERKYARYSWFQDVRSCIRDWVGHFWGILAKAGADLHDQRILVIGAGSGNEAGQVWRRFGKAVTLTDIGTELVENCRREAPEAAVLCAAGESLSSIPSRSVDIYCSLRTYQSFFFDIEASLQEAYRVLSDHGRLIVSVSNGYLMGDGSLAKGQIVKVGSVDLMAPWRTLVAIASAAAELGFARFGFVDLDSELCFTATKCY